MGGWTFAHIRFMYKNALAGMQWGLSLYMSHRYIILAMYDTKVLKDYCVFMTISNNNMAPL